MSLHDPDARAMRRRPSTALWLGSFLLVALTACSAAPPQREGGVADAGDGSVDAIDDVIDVTRPDARDVVSERAVQLCTTDEQCVDSTAGAYCELATGLCRPCLPSPNTCTGGKFCDATFTCVDGCARDEDCASGGDGGTSDGGAARTRCDTASHACVQCLGDLDCPTNLVCATSSHTCVMGCSASVACPTGQDCCGNQCLDLLNDNAHCGSCGHACGASETCCGGICYDLANDPRHCGNCSMRCSISNGVAGCAAGRCSVDRCFPGFGDCNNDPSDGCEAPTSNDPLHCGTCANVCASGPHATAACTAGVCSSSCAPGYLDCNGGSDGCEVDLNNDPNNCGVCGRVCTGANATGGCTNGVCVVASCATGYADCNRRGDDGCEVDVRADPLNCGACFQYCTSGANSTSSCVNSACRVSCTTGYGDCNAMAADGCESNFATDALHCGSCTTPCPARANATPTCTSSTCGFICQAGFQNCNTTASDGCEINVRTDVNNCGSCGMRCTATNATPACTAGGCAIGSCNAGYSDCDGMLSNGCEVHSAVDSSNCGACGTVCIGGQTCVNGACTLVNPFPSTGTEGAFAPMVNTVLPAGIHNYTTINIPMGVTVTVSGNGVLDLRATGDVTIAGTIDLTGGVGGNGVRPTGGGGGGATAIQQTAATGIPGSAGTGGMGTAGSAASGCSANAPGGAFGGGAATLGTGTVGGGGGGGTAGGAGGLIGTPCIGGAGAGGATAGAGGQAGGPPYDGLPGQSGMDPCNGLLAGGGGGSIGMAAVTDLAMATTFVPGSGGGGGSARYTTGLSGAEGGGGGGGGAIRISSPTRITIASTGRVIANGGAGGNGNDAQTTCTLNEGGAGGGGGSGGAIYIAAPTVSVTGTVSAVGGAAGRRGANATGGDGGAGGLGRIRISATTSSCTLTGSFNPPLRSGCMLSSTQGNAYIGQYPR